jgi:hypothetical protein
MAIEFPPPPEQCTLSLVDFRFPYFLFRRSILPIALDTIGRKAVSEREREVIDMVGCISLELNIWNFIRHDLESIGWLHWSSTHTCSQLSLYSSFLSLYINCPNVLLRKGSKGQASRLYFCSRRSTSSLFIHPGTLARVTRARLRLRTFDIDSALIETQFPSLFARPFLPPNIDEDCLSVLHLCLYILLVYSYTGMRK